MYKPMLKSIHEIIALGNYIDSLKVSATLLLGDLGLDPSEYVKYVSNAYVVSGIEDDIIVTKQARELGILLDGRCVSFNEVVVCGVGGLNPYQDMERVLSIVGRDKLMKPSITVSYHPVHQCGDLINELGVHRGLPELREFIASIKPLLHVAGGESLSTCVINEVIAHSLSPRALLVINVRGEAVKPIKCEVLQLTSH